MRFYSTNKQCSYASLKEAVMTGLAPDGGLYMPVHIPVIPRAFFNNISEMTIANIAYVVANTMLGEDIDSAWLNSIVNDTFSFDIPLKRVEDNIYCLELFHGPTLAFKDVGARFLARIISHFAAEGTDNVNVLVATSGDSGGAVANGFLNVRGVKVFILYPENGLTEMQKAQFTHLGGNIHPIAVRGTFDNCQHLVKTAFNDNELRNKMRLTSANTINICRLLPQMFYYFYGVAQLPELAKMIDNVVISVPCGNLGNLTAGLLAHRMGLPVKRFVAANNSNDVFSNYLKEGRFEPQIASKTIAHGMDVGNPSNFSRIMDMFDGDYCAVCNLISGYSYSDEDIRETMADTYSIDNYLLDPHGATAFRALKENLQPGETGIFLATAHPSKTSRIMKEVTGVEFKNEDKIVSVHRPSTIPRISSSYDSFKKILISST
ncbi:MAG: threonine synthase [Duncaniella sp.]|nr:threonine synthase [Muribaculum sp.]MCM1254531.1 threonine synthase [Duncaniella sp.]